MKRRWVYTFCLLLISAEAFASDWKYQPISSEFWTSGQTLISEKKFEEALLAALKNPTSEGELLAASAAKMLGLTYYSYQLYLNIVRKNPATNQAHQALLDLSALHSSINLPEKDLFELINEGRQTETPNSAQSMISYFLMLDNMKKGFHDWAKKDFNKIERDSYWYRKFRFLMALDAVKNNQFHLALERLSRLGDDPKIEGPLKKDVDWQRARIHLELGQLDEAEKIYSGFLFSGRDFGRAVLERAWIRYYKKDFSTALGLLYSLRAPFFDSSRSAEQYLLSMLIYRDLCHYTSAQRVAKDYEKVYEPIISTIKAQPLVKIPNLLNSVLVRSQYLPSADLVHSLRSEQALLKSSKFDLARKFLGKAEKIYANAERMVRLKLEKEMREELKEIANAILVARDQVKLLDYLAGLEKLRWERNVASSEYVASKVDADTYKNLYWPVTTEFWWEETGKLKVLIKDQCQGARQ